MIQTLVLKVGGAVALEDDTIASIGRGITALHGAGVRIVIVHGGGPQIDRALSALGETTVKHHGLRVTSPKAAHVVQRELDAIGAALTARLVAAGHPAVHVPSAACVFHATQKVLPDGFDLGRVGTVRKVELAPARAGDILVVTPVGTDGGPLNVNADEAAGALARALHADRLLLATDVPHVLDADGHPIPALDAAACHALIASGAAKGGMIPKIMAALTSLEAGVEDVLIARLGPDTMARAAEAVPSEGTWVTLAPRLETTA